MAQPVNLCQGQSQAEPRQLSGAPGSCSCGLSPPRNIEQTGPYNGYVGHSGTVTYPQQ